MITRAYEPPDRYLQPNKALLRNEIVSKAKYYFWDNGIRNALIAQFNPLDQRNDIGQLWENFIFRVNYSGMKANGQPGKT